MGADRWRVAESPVGARGSSAGGIALHWILRVAVAACFIGHGAFGVITKAAWLPYFAIFGIPEAWAWKLMPLVGAVDISIGILTLIQPVRAVILYMAFWGFQTACLRPLAGQGIWELLERAGNYGVPLAFLCLLGAGLLTDWFSARPMPTLTVARASAIGWILRDDGGVAADRPRRVRLRHAQGLDGLRCGRRHQRGQARGPLAHTPGGMVRVHSWSARPRLADARRAALRLRVEARHRSPPTAGR